MGNEISGSYLNNNFRAIYGISWSSASIKLFHNQRLIFSNTVLIAVNLPKVLTSKDVYIDGKLVRVHLVGKSGFVKSRIMIACNNIQIAGEYLNFAPGGNKTIPIEQLQESIPGMDFTNIEKEPNEIAPLKVGSTNTDKRPSLTEKEIWYIFFGWLCISGLFGVALGFSTNWIEQSGREFPGIIFAVPYMFLVGFLFSLPILFIGGLIGLVSLLIKAINEDYNTSASIYARAISKKRKEKKLTKATVVNVKTNDTATIPQTKYKEQQSKAEIRREVESEIQQQLKEVKAAKAKAVLVFIGVGFVTLFFLRDVVWGVGILVYLGIWVLYAVAYGWQHFYNHTDS